MNETRFFTPNFTQLTLTLLLSLALPLGIGCSDDDTPNDSGSSGTLDGGSDATNTDGGMSTSWEELGDQLSPAGAESEDPVMLAVNGKPAVGYRHAGFRVYLQTWDGSWSTTAPDPTGNNTLTSAHRTPDMCSTGDAIYMVYAAAGESTANDAAFYDRVYAYRWTSANSWEVQNGGLEISEPWNSVTEVGYDADEPSIACRGTATPAIAWAEVDAVAEQEVDAFATFLGGTRSPRIDRDTDGVAGTGVRTTDVAATADGKIYVAQFEDTGSDTDLSTQLYVTSYIGGTLQHLGDALDIDFDSNTLAPPSLAIDQTSGQLYVAWAADRDDSGYRDIRVARWDSSWTLLASPVSALGQAHVDANNPDLIVRNGVLTLAWNESDQDGQYIFVAELRDGTWNVIGDRLNVDLQRTAADPSLADVDGKLHVAFEEAVDGYPQIFVKHRIEP